MATRGSIAPRGSVAIAQSKQGVGTPQFASYDERAAASGGQVLYGLDKELAEKAAAKYDVGMEHKCRKWIEAVTGDKLGESTLQEELKNGVVLCNLINAIKISTEYNIADILTKCHSRAVFTKLLDLVASKAQQLAREAH